jgi:SPP1 family predicted phage head-tail adaptor
MMHVGMLNKFIELQEKTQTQDPSGQRQDSWKTIAGVYANIKPLVGRDYLAAQQVVDEVSHDVTIKYRRGVKPQMRVKYLNLYYEIVSVIDPNEMREWLFLKCREAVEV